MRSWVEAFAIALLLLCASVPVGAQEDEDEPVPPPPRGTIQIGVDPAEDASYPLVAAADLGYPALSQRARVDIRALELIPGNPAFRIDINLSAPFRGTASVMYVVHMTMGDNVTYACWNPQNVTVDRPVIGGTVHNEPLDQDVHSCDRFAGTGITRVGPATTSQGVQRGVHPDGTPYVRWTIDKSAFGGPGLVGIKNVTAETWVRGLDPAPPSTTVSNHLWARADRAPDVGEWNHSFLGVPFQPPAPLPPPTRLVLEPATTEGLTAPAGETTTVPFGVGIDQGEANITFLVDAVGVDARFEPALLAFDPAHPAAVTNLVLDVPADARGALLVQTWAISDTGLETRIDLNFTVVNHHLIGAAGPDDEEEPDFDQGPGRVKTIDVRQAPGAGTMVLVVALAVGAALAGRRRP